MWSLKEIGQKLVYVSCPAVFIGRLRILLTLTFDPWPKINKIPPLITNNLHVKFESDSAKTFLLTHKTKRDGRTDGRPHPLTHPTTLLRGNNKFCPFYDDTMVMHTNSALEKKSQRPRASCSLYRFPTEIRHQNGKLGKSLMFLADCTLHST